MIYLDNAATSFPKPDCVTEQVSYYMRNIGASAGRGGHSSSIKAAEILIECQNEIAALFSIPAPERIIFTKNATEAINTAIFGYVKGGDEMIISSMEHNAVLRCAHECSKRGITLKIAHGNNHGRVSPQSIENLITPKTRLICLIHASNVTGTINDIYTVQKIARKHNVTTLFDCSQSAGVVSIDASDFDMVAFPGHKALLGPMGTGVLYVREGITLSPLLFGGTGSFSESVKMPDFFPDRFHAGTLNISGIAGLCEGVKFVKKEGGIEKEKEITDYMYSLLSEIPKIIIPGEKDRASVISVVVPKSDSVALAEKLNSFDIATRAGLHCAPMAHRTIGTIQTGTLRFSPGIFTEKSDVDFAVNSLKKIIENV